MARGVADDLLNNKLVAFLKWNNEKTKRGDENIQEVFRVKIFSSIFLNYSFIHSMNGKLKES